MIAHVVCFKMKPYADGKSKNDNLQELKKRVESLKDDIPQVKSSQFGINERGGEYDAVLVELFETNKCLEIYDNAEPHIKVKEYIKSVCEKMSVIDYSF